MSLNSMVGLTATNRRAASVRVVAEKVFDILKENPEGLNTYSLFRSLEQSIQEFKPDPVLGGKSEVRRKLGKVFRLATTAPVNAGWLISTDGHWRISPEGLRALEQVSDPGMLLDDAGRKSFKGWLSVKAPRFYLFVWRAKYQFGVELGLIKRLGLRRLLRSALKGLPGTSPNWKQALPLQPVKTLEISSRGIDSLPGFLESKGVAFTKLSDGSIYVGPHENWRDLLADDFLACPPDAAMIIGGENKPGSTGDRATDRHDVRDVLVANLLNAFELGPRLYDRKWLKFDNSLFKAWIVASQDERALSSNTDRNDFTELERDGLLRRKNHNTRAAQSSDARNNRVAGVNFDDFTIGRYSPFLKETATRAADVSHWGDRSLLRGWKYLYQAVPGVSMPARRDCGERMESLTALMNKAGVDVKDRLVLDFGANMGMMMAQYLKASASWVHGWDMASLTPHTEKLLLALGCTRFSITGCDLTRDRKVESDLPDFLAASLEGSVISYLAVRGPLGWLKSLATIPWEFMIYEGHEEESEKDLERFVAELNELVPVRIAVVDRTRDGDSEPRTVAILKRVAN